MWQYNYNTTDTNTLQHSGVIGMHWRHRKAQAISAKTERRTGIIENKDDLAKMATKDREEADSRVKFYGGKNVALDVIKKEAKYQSLIGYADAFKKSAIGSAALGTGITAINKHAKTQSAYTVDSKFGVNNVVAQYRH